MTTGAAGVPDLQPAHLAMERVPQGAASVLITDNKLEEIMQTQNWHHIQAPIEAPDDSVVRAAEAEYLGECIADAFLALTEAKAAAQNEWNREAREHIRRAKFQLECALEPQED